MPSPTPKCRAQHKPPPPSPWSLLSLPSLGFFKALVSYYSASFGSFGFAAFYDAAQNRTCFDSRDGNFRIARVCNEIRTQCAPAEHLRFLPGRMLNGTSPLLRTQQEHAVRYGAAQS